jgi:dynein assembly factor 6, axonemal
MEATASTAKGKVNPKYEIWSQEEVADLPISKHDPRKQPFFETLYRQKVGTEDVFLGLGGKDPSSNCCQ